MTFLDVAVDRFRKSGKNPTLRDTGGGYFGSMITSTGKSVAAAEALSIPVFLACVRIIASSTAQLPIRVKVEQEDGTSKRDLTRDTWTLRGRPNPEQTRFELFERLTADLVLGDCFIFIEKDGLGQPMALWHIPRSRVRVGRARSSGRKVYLVDDEIPMINYSEGGEVVHIPNFGIGLRGLDIVKVAEQSIALGLTALEYATRAFLNGAIPPGIISVEGLISDDEADRVEARWSAARATVARAFRVAVLSGNAKFQQLSQDFDKLQLMPLRRYQAGEMCTLTGVPPFMVGLVDTSTSWGTGIAEQSAGFITFTLGPYLARIEQAIDAFILVRELTNRYAKFDTGALLRGTTLQRYQAHALGYGRWLSTNDIRRDEDLDPVDGGDDVFAAVNLVPIDELNKQIADTAPQPKQLPPGKPGDDATK